MIEQGTVAVVNAGCQPPNLATYLILISPHKAHTLIISDLSVGYCCRCVTVTGRGRLQ